MKIYIGIDNGVTGSITVLQGDGMLITHLNTPVKHELGYQKSKAKMIHRIDFNELLNLFRSINIPSDTPLAIVERPMVNSLMFQASISAVRALEAMLIALETARIPYMYIDSKEWQGKLLPPGCNGKDALKLASDSLALRLYPGIKLLKKGNGDSVMIARYGVTEKL